MCMVHTCTVAAVQLCNTTKPTDTSRAVSAHWAARGARPTGRARAVRGAALRPAAAAARRPRLTRARLLPRRPERAGGVLRRQPGEQRQQVRVPLALPHVRRVCGTK